MQCPCHSDPMCPSAGHLDRRHRRCIGPFAALDGPGMPLVIIGGCKWKMIFCRILYNTWTVHIILPFVRLKSCLHFVFWTMERKLYDVAWCTMLICFLDSGMCMICPMMPMMLDLLADHPPDSCRDSANISNAQPVQESVPETFASAVVAEDSSFFGAEARRSTRPGLGWGASSTQHVMELRFQGSKPVALSCTLMKFALWVKMNMMIGYDWFGMVWICWDWFSTPFALCIHSRFVST